MSDPVSKKEQILKVEGLKMHFPVRGGILYRQTGSVKAVDGVDLSIRHGETLGLVGESGCGKSTLGKCIVRLLKPTGGKGSFQRNGSYRYVAIVLAPLPAGFPNGIPGPGGIPRCARMSVGELISEPMVIQKIGTRGDRVRRVEELLELVGLPKNAAQKFSFEFSGGQRQRIGIARALAVSPDLLVLDEPVSALDVSVQSQVLNLLMDLQNELGLSYLFIAHDLAVVKHVSGVIAVMYLGKIVEIAPAEELYANPLHAYTKALISAIPVPDPSVDRKRIVIPGGVPSPIDPPPECAFGHRVNAENYQASVDAPLGLKEVADGHWVLNCPCCVNGQGQ